MVIKSEVSDNIVKIYSEGVENFGYILLNHFPLANRRSEGKYQLH